MSNRKPPKLYKVLFDNNGNESWNLVAAVDHKDAINRVIEILGIKPACVKDAAEVNTGISNLLLSTQIIDSILEVGAKQYCNRLAGKEPSQYLNDQNRLAIQAAKIKLKS